MDEKLQKILDEKGITLPDPSDSFAQVELYRWQYGELPPHGDERPLDVSAGLEGMASAIMNNDEGKFPSPHGVSVALNYAAKLLRKSNAPNELPETQEKNNG